MSPELTFSLPDELLEAIARRAAELVDARPTREEDQERPEWITAKGAAEILPYTVHHVWRLGRKGAIRTKRVGPKYVRFSRVDVEDLAAGRRPGERSRSAGPARTGSKPREKRTPAKRRRF
jgi:hypothetical protein